MRDIAIFGAGGFGREVLMLIEQINELNPIWNFIGFFDDGVSLGNLTNGYKIWGGVNELNSIKRELFVVLAIGDPATKKKLVQTIHNSFIGYPNLIHPNVCIGKYVQLGEGVIITSGCILTENIQIGNHIILNLQCTVGHDSVINDYCSFMPSVSVSGETQIEEGVYVGTKACIINKKRIGKGSVVGAGAVVIKDVPEGVTVVGNPAREIIRD